VDCTSDSWCGGRGVEPHQRAPLFTWARKPCYPYCL